MFVGVLLHFAYLHPETQRLESRTRLKHVHKERDNGIVLLPVVIQCRMVLAQKFFDEICFKSEFYAAFANLTVSQLNSLEVDFLCRIHFSLMVYPAQYQTFYNHMRLLCQVPCLKASC